MALAMAISSSGWSKGGTTLLHSQGMEMQARKTGRARLVVVASKKSKLRKKTLDDEPSPYAPSSLPLLDDFANSSHVGFSSKLQMTEKQETKSEGANGHADVLPRGTTASLSLDEFLKARVEENVGDEEDEEDKVEVWEGDSTPMTAEEEKRILAEAQRELSELRKRHGEAFNASRESFDDESDEWDSNSSDTDEKTVEVWRGDKLEVWKDSAESSGSEFTDDESDDEAQTRSIRKGVPAVMRCFDGAKVYVKAGDGGNGEVAFRREKFVPHGGPSGGNGGKGGNIYFEVDTSLNSLLSFRKSVHFRAGRGGHGLGKSQDGAYGQDCVIRVPPGTVVREGNGSGKLLLELTKPGQRELLLPGGRGGRGNAAFKSAKNKTPQISEKGEQGTSMWVELELKLVADVGIIGVPNAGKSTLLSAISAARPAIASYPFTTLLPNLGVVSLDFDATMVVADLPGLLEGAHAGYGLGHEFLRHTERCRVLIHVIDGTSSQPELEYEAVRLELQLFNPKLSSKASIVAFNKMDVPEAAERWESFRQKMEAQGVHVCCMSAATLQGTSEIVRAAYQLLQSAGNSNTEEEAFETQDVAEMVKKERSAPIGEFRVIGDPESDSWYIQGAGLERFTQMTNWEYFESLQRFERVLEYSGVNAELKSKGIHEGDRVFIGDMSFIWHDSNDFAKAGSWSRGQRGSKHWPH